MSFQNKYGLNYLSLLLFLVQSTVQTFEKDIVSSMAQVRDNLYTESATVKKNFLKVLRDIPTYN